MKNKKLLIGLVSSFTAFTLTACGDSNENTGKDTNKDNNIKTEEPQNNQTNHDNKEMNHSESGEVPADIKTAANPTYKIGSKVIINADHMKGMDSAEAKVVGAYDTTAYMITYTPADGGEKVKNHKWIIQEEIKDAGNKTLKTGSEVTIEADHMKGMNGAKAVIESSKDTTVYMVDYTPTTGGDKVKNHKWLIEDELKSK